APESTSGQLPTELEWCERRLLQRIHRYTIEAHRQSIKPVALQSYIRFLFDLHEIKPQRLPVSAVSMLSGEGQAILQRSLERLDGLVAPAASWESDILSTRVSGYDPAWLDVMCISGRVVWGRHVLPAVKSIDDTASTGKGRRSGPGTIKSSPITMAMRSNLDLWEALARSRTQLVPEVGAVAERIEQDLRQHGASFVDQISRRTGLLRSQ